MHVKARMPLHPLLDLGVLMSGVIIHDEMKGLVLGGLPINQPQEGQPLCVAMARETRGDDLSFGHIKGGK